MADRVELTNESPENLAALARYASGEITAKTYCDMTGHGGRVARRLKDEYTERPVSTPKPEMLDLDEEDRVERNWSMVESSQHQTLRENEIPWDYHIDLQTNLPVLIAWVADMHIGHSRSNLRKIRQDLEMVRDTEGMYVVFGGDDGENTTSSRAHHGAHHERIMTTTMERQFIEHAFNLPGEDKDGRPKTLGIGEGNHTARSIQDDGASWLKEMCEANGLHYYGYRQRYNIRVGRWEYRIIYAHRHRGGGLDPTRPSKKLIEDWGHADAAMTAHTHRIAIAQEYAQLEPRAVGVAGSYKDRDDFSGSRGYTPSKAIMPGCILYPDSPRELSMIFNVFSPRELRKFQREREWYRKRVT